MAARMGCSKSTVAAVERGTTGMDARLLARMAAVAGLRLALVDEAGREVPSMTDAGARDRGYRRLPPHLHTIPRDERRSHWEVRKTRAQPTYTFDRIRADRDDRRRRRGTPHDHEVEQPGDSPAQRAAARREAARRRAEEAHQRWLESGAARLADGG